MSNLYLRSNQYALFSLKNTILKDPKIMLLFMLLDPKKERKSSCLRLGTVLCDNQCCVEPEGEKRDPISRNKISKPSTDLFTGLSSLKKVKEAPLGIQIILGLMVDLIQIFIYMISEKTSWRHSLNLKVEFECEDSCAGSLY